MDFIYEVRRLQVPSSFDAPRQHLSFDPIGSHLIELRKYYLELSTLLHAAQDKSEKIKKGNPAKEKILVLPSFPAFPEGYLFSGSLDTSLKTKGKSIIRCKGNLSEKQSKKQRRVFAKKVLAQTGFYVEDLKSDDLPLEYLSDATDEFLQKFINHMKCYKNRNFVSGKKEDLQVILETTLQNLGIGGISALHTFYYENIVKKHDILLNSCKDLYNQYQKFIHDNF